MVYPLIARGLFTAGKFTAKQIAKAKARRKAATEAIGKTKGGRDALKSARQGISGIKKGVDAGLGRGLGSFPQRTGTQSLGFLPRQQQQMQQADIAQLGQAGGLQRQIADRTLAAQRATTVARQYEPFQRMEFAKGIMTTLPTAASQITQSTGPGTNPFAQAIGAGVGAYSAYQMVGPGGKGSNVVA